MFKLVIFLLSVFLIFSTIEVIASSDPITVGVINKISNNSFTGYLSYYSTDRHRIIIGEEGIIILPDIPPAVFYLPLSPVNNEDMVICLVDGYPLYEREESSLTPDHSSLFFVLNTSRLTVGEHLVELDYAGELIQFTVLISSNHNQDIKDYPVDAEQSKTIIDIFAPMKINK